MEGQRGVKKRLDSPGLPARRLSSRPLCVAPCEFAERREAEEAAGDDEEEEEQRDLLRQKKVQLCV